MTERMQDNLIKVCFLLVICLVLILQSIFAGAQTRQDLGAETKDLRPTCIKNPCKTLKK